ncbi:chitin disaccharide deacetylase [Serratia sp. NA_112.1]|uniref:chitin disaccharide deacetylase n=1 Tax=Serratia sp. NA_112.1 TaxID=3415665 RepID=UPI004046BFC0
MEKLLIVNADDFGLSKGQNYGVIEAYHYGVVSSTTAMVNSVEVHHAARLSQLYSGLQIGLHFVLTHGKPLTAMPSLVNERGELGKWLWERAESEMLDLDEIYNELVGQYDRFVAVFGKAPTHIDSHHHTHMLPQIYPLVEAFAQSKSIPLRIDRQAVEQQNIPLHYDRSTEWFDAGFYGEAISEALFLQVLERADERSAGSVEMMCHPAFLDKTLLESKYCYPRLAEVDVLTAPGIKNVIAERGYRLGSFLDL